MVRGLVLSLLLSLVCCPVFAATQQEAQDAGLAAVAAAELALERRDDSWAMLAQAEAKIDELENRISTLYNELITEGYQPQQAQDAVDAANDALDNAIEEKEVGDSRHSSANADFLAGSALDSEAADEYGNAPNNGNNYGPAWLKWTLAIEKYTDAKNNWHSWSGYYVNPECSYTKYNNARGMAQSGLDDIANLFP